MSPVLDRAVRLGLLVVIVGATAGLSGCAAAAKPAAAAGAIDSAQRSTDGAAPRHSTRSAASVVRVRIVLDRGVARADGAPILGYAQVLNATGKPITIRNACNGWLYAGLATRTLPFDPAIAGVGCQSARLPAGASRVPVSISTTYRACLQPGGQAIGPAPPKCTGTAHNIIPPLPAGRYAVTIATMGLVRATVVAVPMTVRLTTA